MNANMAQPVYSMYVDGLRRNVPTYLAVPQDDVTAQIIFANTDYIRNQQRQNLQNSFRETKALARMDKNRLLVNLDVKHFNLEDLSVKTVDGFLIIRAKHAEKKDAQGWVARQFSRRYTLPEGCNVENVQCRLTPEGLLAVSVPLDRKEKSIERVVPIMQSGPVKSRSESKVEGGDEEENREATEEEPAEKPPSENGE